MSFHPDHPAPLAAHERACDVLVIGAGIVGISVALRLRQRGLDVLVLDRAGVAAETSRGNAGGYAFTQILPLASPRILRKVPRWLLDPLGPMALRPLYLPRMASWLWRFWRASFPAQVEASTAAQHALLQLSASETPALLESVGALDLLREDGILHLYEDERDWRNAASTWQAFARYGIAFEHLHGADAIAAYQPGLSESLRVATFVPGWKSVRDPRLLTHTLAEHLTRLGTPIRTAQVTRLRPMPDGICAELASGALAGSPVRARRVVLCAGAWSHQLARTLGERIPLESERGYNVTLPAGCFDLKRTLSFDMHGFLVSPIGDGLRIGGAVEFGGLNAAPDFRRSEAMLTKTRRFLPGLKAEGGTRWMGHRPSLPDTLPVISPSQADARILYAFGHGHLGLSESAATARLIADLLQGQAAAIDLAPFRAGRF